MLLQSIDSRLHLGRAPNHLLGHRPKFKIEDVSFWYGRKCALQDVSLEIFSKEVTAFLGPSGCGKTTLLRCLNRMNEVIVGTRMEGRILLDDEDIYDRHIDPPMLRRRIGWIAQRPNPFQRSIRANLLYGPQLHGMVAGREDAEALVERSLRAAGLWAEVKDRLDASALGLSIGQQQRLCIARAIAIEPEVILMDEPCSALDPVGTHHVEELIDQLRADFTVIIITHNLQQAARVAQRVAFFHLGKILEVGDADQVFINPRNAQCRDFITGRYG